MNDHELLRDYVENRSQEAFQELVERHLSMVYSAACRMVCDSHLAQEISQDVFSTLAQKGKTIHPPQVVSGWLYNTTRNLAMHAIRTEQRRRNREQTAAAMRADDANSTNDQIHEKLEPAMAELGVNERDALVLRFLENRSLRDVGAELGISEDGARMRVNRALEQLRGAFGRQGISVTSVLLATALASGASSAVPTGLAVAISATALAATAATVSTAITQATLTTMNWINTKTVVATIAAAVVTGIGTYLTQQTEIELLRAENKTLVQEKSEMTAARNEALTASQMSKEESERLRKDASELLRLRNEVGLLREQNKMIRIQEQTVIAANATATNSTPFKGYLSKDEIVFAGYSTPEKAVESAVWAILSTNWETFIRSFDAKTVQKDSIKLRKAFEMNLSDQVEGEFSGIDFQYKKILDENIVEISILMNGKYTSSRFQRLMKIGDDWKMSGLYTDQFPARWRDTGKFQDY